MELRSDEAIGEAVAMVGNEAERAESVIGARGFAGADVDVGIETVFEMEFVAEIRAEVAGGIAMESAVVAESAASVASVDVAVFGGEGAVVVEIEVDGGEWGKDVVKDRNGLENDDLAGRCDRLVQLGPFGHAP